MRSPKFDLALQFWLSVLGHYALFSNEENFSRKVFFFTLRKIGGNGWKFTIQLRGAFRVIPSDGEWVCFPTSKRIGGYGTKGPTSRIIFKEGVFQIFSQTPIFSFRKKGSENRLFGNQGKSGKKKIFLGAK